VQAEAAFRHALRLDSSLPALHARHGRLVSESGQDGSASSVLARDMLSHSASTETAVAYARILAALEHRATAIRLYRSILADQPGNTEVMINLGNLLKAAPDFDGAERLYRDALTANSDNPVPLKNLGDLLARSFRIEDGISHIRRATEIDVRNPYLLSDLIFAEHYAPPSPDSATPASIRLWQSRFGVAKAPNIHLGGTPKDTPLRIGLLSSNFRRHPVGFLALPVLEALDQTKFSILSYANQIDSDEYTARFRAISDQWKPVSHLSDLELRDLIRGDRIDILIEMSGHTAGHRLPVVAQRVAPLQVKWIGGQYNTMGVDSIDCFLSDPVETPTDHEDLHSELVLKLPSSYAGYQAPPYAPDVSALPALSNGRVTFGSLNKINKLNDHTIELWAACLEAIPNSTLLLRTDGLGDPSVAARCHAKFEGFGIPSSRLDLRDSVSHVEALATYREIDIALDPHPYSGCLTTCEALWMGVPVMSWPSETFAGRHSASFLTSVGLQDWIAPGRGEYIECLKDKCSDLPALNELRQTLRARVSKSPLCNFQQIASELETCLVDALDRQRNGLMS